QAQPVNLFAKVHRLAVQEDFRMSGKLHYRAANHFTSCSFNPPSSSSTPLTSRTRTPVGAAELTAGRSTLTSAKAGASCSNIPLRRSVIDQEYIAWRFKSCCFA